MELKELGRIRDCVALCSAADLDLNAASVEELADPHADDTRKNVKTFRSFAVNVPTSAVRRLYFHFLETPTRINGSSRVASITLTKNTLAGCKLEQVAVAGSLSSELPCSLVLRSVGYKGVSLPGVGFDERSGTIPNHKGRCLDGGKPMPGLYVTGWIKRGPSGLIGTNRADSVETVATIVDDLAMLDAAPKPGGAGLGPALSSNGTRVVSYADWQSIDISERDRGRRRGKPREKFTSVADMIAACTAGVRPSDRVE
jgi:ferredoxin--NADP+ reductase